MDFLLAQLIGRAGAIHYRGKGSMPEIATVYPSLFDQEEYQEKKQAKQAEIFSIQLRQFANFHNQKLAEEAAKN